MNRSIASLAKTEMLRIGPHQFPWRLPLQTKLGLGSPIKIGCYLGVDRVKRTYTEEIQLIEADIARIVGEAQPFVRCVVTGEEVRAFFAVRC
ncbi:MAG: hypothetical protein CMM01_18740 [Rhodopirellula sp.]|nr:hypothetical protein [Rhodopirellula sp.]